MKRAERDIRAGLALHEDGLRYIEIRPAGAGFETLRQEFVPLGCVARGSIQRPDDLEGAFLALRERVGHFPCPVTFGLPMGDVYLRLIEYPPMPVSDARGALSLEFERYFPFPWDRAAVGVAAVEAPEAARKTHLLAAASRLELVGGLMKMSSRAKIPVGAFEPVNVAFFRAVRGENAGEGAYLVLEVESGTMHLTFGYRGSGLLFRSVSAYQGGSTGAESALAQAAQEVRNTLEFARGQYREAAAVSRVFIAGALAGDARLKALLAPLEVRGVDVWASWQVQPLPGGPSRFEAALGLALRDRAQVRFDIRPTTHMERGLRRGPFSPARIAAAFLLLLFPAACGGYAVTAMLRAHALLPELAARRKMIADMEARRAELMAEFAQLKSRENRLTRRLTLLEGEPPVLEALNALEAHIPDAGVIVRGIRFSLPDTGPCAMVVEASAEGEEQVLALVGGLRQDRHFRGVNLPGSRRDAGGRVNFSLTLSLPTFAELGSGEGPP